MLQNRNLYLWLIAVSIVFSGSVFSSAQEVQVQEEKPSDKQDKVDLSSLLQQANQDLGAEDFKAAAEKLKKYTDAKKDNEQAWFLLAYSLHMDGQIDQAIPIHKKAAEFDDFRPTALYNLGCAYSLKNDPDKSLEYLHEALDAGFDRLDMFATDGDLENVQKSAGYGEIQARLKNNGKRPEKKFDGKGLVGKWAVTSGSRQGDAVEAERLPAEITFTNKDVTIPSGDDKFVMSYKVIKADKDLIEVDFKIESGPAPEGSAKGILKIDGNKAQLCYDPTGQTRPKDFKTTEENGFFMFAMEKKAEKFDISKIPGTWQVIEGVRAGEDVAKDRLAEAIITFEKDKITIPAGDDEFVMSYSIKADTSPVQIDMKIESGPAPEGSAAVGILKMSDGKFVLCYNPMGGDRPKTFESTEDNGCFLFVMKPADK